MLIPRGAASADTPTGMKALHPVRSATHKVVTKIGGKWRKNFFVILKKLIIFHSLRKTIIEGFILS